ncbi:MAG TPA: hypothetical protein VL171_05155 [Verrucomicrobiae bacterium]|nr:hypothetical protein [Verrucomicrobiae bacterium]
MNKYQKWLDKALEQLSRDFEKGDFHPQNECDIQCHLYHLLLCSKERINGVTKAVVLSEYRVPRSPERIDLAIVKRTRKGNEPRLLLEIKETSKSYLSPAQVEERVLPDVEKLQEYRQSLVIEGHKRISKPAVFFFFRDEKGTGGLRETGIGVIIDNAMRELKRKYKKKVTLDWGPR